MNIYKTPIYSNFIRKNGSIHPDCDLFPSDWFPTQSQLVQVVLFATHIAFDSPLVGRHHQSELFLTMPATLTQKDALLLQSKIVEFIDDFVKGIDSSKGEILYCLNIDWFDVC